MPSPPIHDLLDAQFVKLANSHHKIARVKGSARRQQSYVPGSPSRLVLGVLASLGLVPRQPFPDSWTNRLVRIGVGIGIVGSGC